MTIADTSVWIPHLMDESSPEVEALRARLAQSEPVVGDLIVMEILRGAPEPFARELEREFRRLQILAMAPQSVVLRSARHYRYLRDRGFTVRSQTDCLIATFCIQEGHTLLHRDRDFEPFESFLGLKVAHV